MLGPLNDYPQDSKSTRAVFRKKIRYLMSRVFPSPFNVVLGRSPTGF